MILAEQGCELPDNVFNQDNQSAIHLEKMVEYPAGKSPGTLMFDISL